jgi:hypothetical protein
MYCMTFQKLSYFTCCTGIGRVYNNNACTCSNANAIADYANNCFVCSDLNCGSGCDVYGCQSCSNTNDVLITLSKFNRCTNYINIFKCISASNSLCSSCASGYVLKQNADGLSMICVLCSTTITNCATCSSRTQCTTCSPDTTYGLSLITGGNINCVTCASISNCLTCVNSLCSSCASGYVLKLNTDGLSMICVLCSTIITNCATCLNFSICN